MKFLFILIHIEKYLRKTVILVMRIGDVSYKWGFPVSNWICENISPEVRVHLIIEVDL